MSKSSVPSKMRKQVKKKLLSKHKAVSAIASASKPQEDPKRNETRVTDKLSRIFYNWMRKKKPTVYLCLRSDQFEIRGLICEGTFGKVLMAVNVDTRLTAAAKIENIDVHCPQLLTEYKCYEKLGCDVSGFIKIYHFGPCDTHVYNVLVMELLGPDLDDLFITCDGLFSHKTVLMIAIQTLYLIKHVHYHNIIYRDIKPENFCIGHKYQNKEKIIYIIDFGLSKILEPESTFSMNKEGVMYDYLVGTARYMSVNAHFAYDQSQRDDLESLGYMYAYFLNGHLPWMGLSKMENMMSHYRRIAQLKSCTAPEDLMGENKEFIEYLKYVKTLEYMQKPNYDYLIGIMKDSFKANKYNNDSVFDWSAIMNQRYLHKAIEIDPDD